MSDLKKGEIIELYRKRAKRYDLSAHLYYLIGFREIAQRKKAINLLNLQRGDIVVEIGCGTGLNFSYLQHKIGPEGKIIGVDLTDAMLARAQLRVIRHNWPNVELIQADASRYQFPCNIGGVLSTFAITLIPEYDAVIKRAHQSLLPRKRIVIADLKQSRGCFSLLEPLFIFFTRPFGVAKELADRHPWESIQRYFERAQMKEYFLGFSYIAMGEKEI